jgi:hypothetical protein
LEESDHIIPIKDRNLAEGRFTLASEDNGTQLWSGQEHASWTDCYQTRKQLVGFTM